eukprot:COSAG04_NODE_1550_length_6380_cov_2.250597_1_plen_60_part_00
MGVGRKPRHCEQSELARKKAEQRARKKAGTSWKVGAPRKQRPALTGRAAEDEREARLEG